MLTLERFHESAGTIPGPSTVKYALEHLGLESPMCQFLVQCYGYFGNMSQTRQGESTQLSPQFLAAVLMVMHGRADKRYVFFGNWCEYHKHATRKGRKGRRASRPNDEDVLRLSRAATGG